MQLRCYQCGWSFGISKDEMVAALEALKASGGSHYDAHCPRCKRANKVSIEQLQRSLPRPRPAEKPPT
jgi:phage FluMu protein Com